MSLDQLIPVINKLQDVFNTVGGDAIDLPQIVVIGSQSSGKSSVLENIVGRDFLPRGSGIVTRRPLVLQLVSVPPGDDPHKEEWGEFLHKPNHLFYDFAEIRQEIERETDRLTGSNKGISPNPIRLRVCSPHVLNLTLVDLPGMTRVAVGDQPADIELQIRAMIMQYIQKQNAIILSVSAANTDIANSDGIQLAREVDPEGKRTIGVITKIDIMDKGTDALDVLMGRVIPLSLGFVGVVNRSQADIKAGKTIRDALKSEQEFFSKHPLYRSISSQCGTPYLSKLLNRVLLSHIRDCLPELKARVNKMIGDTQAELRSYGDSYIDNKGAILLQIITKFSNDFEAAIDGKMDGSNAPVHELYGGARINFIFTEIFARCLKSIKPLGDLSPAYIRTAIKNATGPRDSLFIPEASFELLVRKQVQRLQEPALQCVDLVFDELLRIVEKLETQNLQAYKTLQRRVGEVVNQLLLNCKKPTMQMIQNLIAIEHAYVNTAHKDFIGGGGALGGIFESMARSRQQEAIAQQPQGQPTGPAPARPSSQPGMQQPAQQQQQQQQQPRPQQTPQQPQGQQGGGQSGFFNRFFGQQQGGQPGQQQQQPQQPQQRPNQPQRPPQPANPPVGQHRGGQPPQAAAQRPPAAAASAGGRLTEAPRTITAALPNNDSEAFEMELITKLLNSYFLIVRKNVGDTVPKSIMHFLVNTSKTNMQNELIRCLYKEEYFEELLEENPQIAHQRKSCKALLEVLQRANQVLQELRDYNIGGY